MRIDKFLKVSRILKRRTVANEAAKAGKVTVNGKEVKPSYDVKAGDVVTIGFGEGEMKFKIEQVKETVRKEEAQNLYTIL
ncbi:MAG: RNA-binding S4 domain-containing protein [Clostridia bacterium]|nr:RNA-binding S4 domain-containing protein [Clostridia bacterium]MBR1677752.1 RNA-binding S4 domain-containing protein [Clostridia bacterium]